MNRATATAAPTVITVNGSQYTLTPLRDRDWGQFEVWLQDREYDIAKRNIAGMSRETQAELLRHAHDRATAIGFASPEAVQAMNSYAGAVRITLLSLRHAHPEITEDEVAALLFDPTVLAEFMDRLPLGLPDDLGEPLKKKRNGAAKAKRRARKTARTARRL